MTDAELEELLELENLVGSMEGDRAELFNGRYEDMLSRCKAEGRTDLAVEMQRLLFRQFMFLFNEWRNERPQDS